MPGPALGQQSPSVARTGMIRFFSPLANRRVQICHSMPGHYCTAGPYGKALGAYAHQAQGPDKNVNACAGAALRRAAGAIRGAGKAGGRAALAAAATASGPARTAMSPTTRTGPTLASPCR